MDTTAPYQPTHDLSVILPIYEEEESIPQLLDEIANSLRPTGLNYEIIAVDDGSSDRTFPVLREQLSNHPELVIIRFRRNFGQTAAMQAGLDLASGSAVAFMDSDLQNDPADLPMMWSTLWNGDQGKQSNVKGKLTSPSEEAINGEPDEGYDMVVGWRERRQDRFLDRRLPSLIANRIIGIVTGVKIHDYGCSLKMMRGDLAKQLKLYGEMHRFIPAIASWSGARICEVSVHHRARQFGQSKYGLSRTVRVILDLIIVRFMQVFLVRPMQLFGLGGLLAFLAGSALCIYLTVQKLIWGTHLADRPLLLLGVLLIVVGVQLGSMGIIADLLARTYHESQSKPPYVIRCCLRAVSPSIEGDES